jgi:hypothetical protein
MLSHVVIFWTNPHLPHAADTLLAAANQLLKNIPGVESFHAGKMVSSHRPVVDQTYQVALNIGFADKKTEHEYQAHPQHLDFVENYVKPLVKKVLVYDFE